MAEKNFLRWLAGQTPTAWWHDSADPAEQERARANGAVGVTTNPVLTARTLTADPGRWASRLPDGWRELAGPQRAEALTGAVARSAAGLLAPVHRDTGGAHGYVCAQVDPAAAAERETMLAMARRYHAWAANIAVKLPVTAAGLDVLEECVAEGITVTATISFTVPQVLAAAERHRAGAARARAAGIGPGRCFAVIMIGRIDDYVRDAARDRRAPLAEQELAQAGLAISKRAHRLYRERGYEAKLMVAAMRSVPHVTGLAGGDLVLSIHPRYQALLLDGGVALEPRIDREVDPAVIGRLRTVPEFVRAYEPDGLAPEEFLTYGVTQRTLSQFSEGGWSLLEAYGR